jgi:Fe-S cluster biogenesis protein NfuA
LAVSGRGPGPVFSAGKKTAEGILYSFVAKESPMKEKVLAALNKVRPQLQMDGGDVELVEVGEDGLVKVRLTGACGHCPMSQMTLKMGIERFLKKEVPEVKEVVAI